LFIGARGKVDKRGQNVAGIAADHVGHRTDRLRQKIGAAERGTVDERVADLAADQDLLFV